MPEALYPEMKRQRKQDFLTYLPSQIITSILSSLPIRTIVQYKCVCKQWLHLLETDEFVRSHLAISVPTLAVLTPTWKPCPNSISESEYGERTRSLPVILQRDSSLCIVFEFEDDQNLERHDHHFSPLTNFDFPHSAEIKGSANGLLFLSKPRCEAHSEDHYVCNPITREYVEVRCPKELVHLFPSQFNCPEVELFFPRYPQPATYGFGASKITGQHKVVRIFHGRVTAPGGRRIVPIFECHVHTLGTGSWRRVESSAPFQYSTDATCVFLNGNLHWIVSP
ncbi:F-box/LRR-repeat protein At2g43260-like [Salvia miltiorrhiza]|uniref:F-box/LRR-repeat protein At2g43260-like n=1 Tax=Salvia miltiorrhiza TaxID=226208 RepID=UPI0025ABD872|nr:F-box/LRR-repeat protein At2g43260-like [Salvia miltiorrhiza]